MDRHGAAEHRRRLLQGLSGRVVEVGAGDGANFALYPASVTEVVAVEPEPYLRARAEEAAGAVAVPVRVVDGTSTSIPLADASVDAGVASLVLCSVPDQAAALAELRRVIRPGGELRFYEHVIARRPRHAKLFRLADNSGVWPKLGAGCHLSRETDKEIARAGFEIERMRPLSFNGLPHVLGVART